MSLTCSQTVEGTVVIENKNILRMYEVYIFFWCVGPYTYIVRIDRPLCMMADIFLSISHFSLECKLVSYMARSQLPCLRLYCLLCGKGLSKTETCSMITLSTTTIPARRAHDDAISFRCIILAQRRARYTRPMSAPWNILASFESSLSRRKLLRPSELGMRGTQLVC